MSKSTLKILPTLIVAITAALVTQPVFGAPDHQLVFTENSSTDLSVTYDGSKTGITVTNLGADHWSVSLPSNLTFTTGPGFEWLEPELGANGGPTNFVTFASSSASVFSETGDSIITPNEDESTVTNVGVDSRDQLPISATFDDDGDVATVPDTGTTFSLFGLSLMGLAFLRRKLC